MAFNSLFSYTNNANTLYIQNVNVDYFTGDDVTSYFSENQWSTLPYTRNSIYSSGSSSATANISYNETTNLFTVNQSGIYEFYHSFNFSGTSNNAGSDFNIYIGFSPQTRNLLFYNLNTIGYSNSRPNSSVFAINQSFSTTYTGISWLYYAKANNNREPYIHDFKGTGKVYLKKNDTFYMRINSGSNVRLSNYNLTAQLLFNLPYSDDL